MPSLYEINKQIEEVINNGFAVNEETGEILFDSSDLDELQEAFEKSEISQKDYDMAYRVANELIKRYSTKEKIEKLAEFSNKYLEILKRK